MEKEEGHLRCYAADGINIVHQIGMLMREILRQRGNEALCRGSNIVSGSILGHVYAVGTVQWHWLCFEAVDDTKITEQTMHVPAGVKPSDNVHSGVEHSTEAAERHQSATNHRILLDDGNPDTLLRQKSSTYQATKAPSYYHCTFYCRHNNILSVTDSGRSGRKCLPDG